MPRSPEMGGAPPEQEREKMQPGKYEVFLTYTTKDGAQKRERLAVFDLTRWSRPKPLHVAARELIEEINRFDPVLNLRGHLTQEIEHMGFKKPSTADGVFSPSQVTTLSLIGNDSRVFDFKLTIYKREGEDPSFFVDTFEKSNK